MHGKDEFLQAIQVLAPRFRLFGTSLPDDENAGGSAICIHKDLLPEEATVTHLIACRGRDRLVNIRSGRHGLVLSTSISDLNLPCGGCVAGCVLFARAGLFVPVVWAFFLGDSSIYDPEGGQFNVRNQASTDGHPGKTAGFHSFFPHVPEIAQSDYTRRDATTLGVIRTLSWIDRILYQFIYG